MGRLALPRAVPSRGKKGRKDNCQGIWLLPRSRPHPQPSRRPPLRENEAVTPAPTPKTDPETGARVYHAVADANDLRVAIERTPCTDVMSGKPFATTVTVTLNGQTYGGCGEAHP